MMKAIFSGVHSGRGDEQIALALAIIVVGDDHHLAFGEGLDDVGNGIGHGNITHKTAFCTASRRAARFLWRSAGDDATGRDAHPGRTAGPRATCALLRPGHAARAMDSYAPDR